MTTPIVFLIIVSLLIGVYSGKRIQGNVRNYFVGGNVLPMWVLVFSMAGQAIELGGTQDNTERAMKAGFWDGAVLPIGVGLSLVVIGLFFAKPLHAMRLLTLPDYYVRRFNGPIGAIVALLCVTSFIVLTAGNLAGLGLILHVFVGWSPAASISAVAAVVTLYTIVGGLFAVTWNDILQIGVACVAFLAVGVWAFTELTVLSPVQVVLTSISIEPVVSFDKGAMRFWASLLALALGDVIALDFMERVFAARSARAAQVACFIAGLTTIACGILLALVGVLLSSLLAPGQESSLLDLAANHFPAPVKVLFVMGLIGTGLSTIDGAIMACSVALSRNVLQFTAPKLVTQTRLLSVSRMVTVPIAILSAVLAIKFPIPGELLVLAFDVVFAGCFVPLALGIFWKRGTARAAMWAVTVPSILRVVIHFVLEDLGIDPRLQGLETLVPPLVSLVLFVGLSLCERKPAAAMEAS